MILLPAIDIKDGKCVRLVKGDFQTIEQVALNALSTAKSFQQEGAYWIHMVDLDGALSGEPINSQIFLDIAQHTDLKIELGGGIRDMEAIEFYLAKGVERIVLGSMAVAHPDLVESAVRRYGNRIAVGIDALDGWAKVSGWLVDGRIKAIDLGKRMEALGVETIIYTDIARDGTLEGPNFEQLFHLQKELSVNIIASGGITTIDDIKKLKAMDLYGAILGKALYQKKISLKEVLEESNRKDG
jgi:phosphoribosylformimino-5-aminoimidazole carboxamide ribotide isomerase